MTSVGEPKASAASAAGSWSGLKRGRAAQAHPSSSAPQAARGRARPVARRVTPTAATPPRPSPTPPPRSRRATPPMSLHRVIPARGRGAGCAPNRRSTVVVGWRDGAAQLQNACATPLGRVNDGWPLPTLAGSTAHDRRGSSTAKRRVAEVQTRHPRLHSRNPHAGRDRFFLFRIVSVPDRGFATWQVSLHKELIDG